MHSLDRVSGQFDLLVCLLGEVGGAYHAFITVWKQHSYTTLTTPLCLTTRDELINDALCRVVKVTKLCLPDDQRLWVRHGEAKLKSLGRRKKEIVFSYCSTAESIA